MGANDGRSLARPSWRPGLSLIPCGFSRIAASSGTVSLFSSSVEGVATMWADVLKRPHAPTIVRRLLTVKYFDIACRRISEALKQPDLFIERPKPAKQESFI
jgi:hypothetical protein